MQVWDINNPTKKKTTKMDGGWMKDMDGGSTKRRKQRERCGGDDVALTISPYLLSYIPDSLCQLRPVFQ
jgi:hypothetical protein